jgi:protein CpxP
MQLPSNFHARAVAGEGITRLPASHGRGFENPGPITHQESSMNLRPALLLTSLLALPLVALSQAPAAPPEDGGPHAGHHGPPSPDRMAEHMQRKLGLDDKQTAQVRELMEDFHKDMQKLHDKHQAALKKVLTPEQLAKLDEMRSERHERFRSHRRKSGEAPAQSAPDAQSE